VYGVPPQHYKRSLVIIALQILHDGYIILHCDGSWYYFSRSHGFTLYYPYAWFGFNANISRKPAARIIRDTIPSSLRLFTPCRPWPGVHVIHSDINYSSEFGYRLYISRQPTITGPSCSGENIQRPSNPYLHRYQFQFLTAFLCLFWKPIKAFPWCFDCDYLWLDWLYSFSVGQKDKQ